MQKITPFLWFETQAQEAAKLYTSVFENSRILDANPMVVTFEIEGQQIVALNGRPEHNHFTEAFSFYVNCEDQDEIDRLWDLLTADGGEPGQCGWLKDRFGLSWQIIPKVLSEGLADPDPAKAGRVAQAMMGMQKIDIRGIEDAYATEG